MNIFILILTLLCFVLFAFGVTIGSVNLLGIGLGFLTIAAILSDKGVVALFNKS